MNRYVAMLRGINIGSKNRVAMPDLKAIFEKAGYSAVETYIQSGNVIFSASQTSEDLETAISRLIRDKLELEVPVIVRSAGELNKAIKENPFLARPTVEKDKLHITFLSTEPAPGLAESIQAPADGRGDEFMISGRDVFLYCPVDYGHTKLTNSFFEKKLKVSATTRNWKSVIALEELSS